MTDTTVAAGQVSNGDVLNAGDRQFINDGGTAVSTTINASGSQEIEGGGLSNNVHVASGGFQYVQIQGYSVGTVLDGGSQIVLAQDEGHGIANYSNPAAVATVINAGGNQYDYNTATNTVVNMGGTQNVYGNAFNTTVNAGGTQIIDLRGLISTPQIDLTTVNEGGVQSIVYGSPTHTILATGGSIIFQQSSYAAGGTATLDKATDILTVVDTGQTFSLNLAGNYDSTTFDLSARDDHLQVTAHAVCFCRGTAIRTPHGDRAVESLRPGDAVVTPEGIARTIRWVGSSAAVVNNETRPVIITAGAFPDGTPHRDLRVTRGHSFVFGQVLIPIGELVDGITICWDTAARYVQVFHVELDQHDILLAEGARAESYRDDGNRVGFQVADGAARGTMSTCLPVVSAGPVVKRTRRRLAEHSRTAAQSPIVRGSVLVSSSSS